MKLTDYELERKRRIEDNKARMQQLGLSQTISDIKVAAHSEKVRARQVRANSKAHRAATATAPSRQKRRSERVQGQPAPTYDERVLAGIDRERASSGNPRDRRLLKENTTEEIYTLEHLNALGSCEKEWDLFVDGYDTEGNRIYDKVRGQTCHQCRQKTLGKRTSCADCQSLHGVFCGDCLYMRYGEHVEEANDNPEWVCPPCRDLCNCSFHRSRRGWAPTGTLYRRALAQGYKSVAHYLVLNNLEDGVKELALPMMPEGLAQLTREELAASASHPAPVAAKKGAVSVDCDALLVPSSVDASSEEEEEQQEEEAAAVAKKQQQEKKGTVKKTVTIVLPSKRKSSSELVSIKGTKKKVTDGGILERDDMRLTRRARGLALA